MAVKIKPFDVTQHLTSDEQIAGYLEAALEEGNPETIALVREDIERARSANAVREAANAARRNGKRTSQTK